MRKVLPSLETITSDTPLRLSIAAALAYPDGSMTSSGLRREAARGRLTLERTAGRDYVTLGSIDRMRELCRVEAKGHACGLSQLGAMGIPVALPPRSPARIRWLTRSEAARLLWTAWRLRQRQNGEITARATAQHVARFILVALYTGTRAGAICGAAFKPTVGRGWVDHVSY